MSRPWHVREYISSDLLHENLASLSRELERASAECPTDSSGMAQRLSIEARKELLHRVYDLLEEQSLEQILRLWDVWEQLPAEAREDY